MDPFTKKYIIAIRHGERSDFSGQTPKFHIKDPELSKHGEEQAFNAGKYISQELVKLGLNSQNAKIQIFSSPFVRTFQTSRGLIKGIQSENTIPISDTIKVDCNLFEFLNPQAGLYPEDIPIMFLHSARKDKLFKEEFKDTKLDFYTSFKVIPKEQEILSMVGERLSNYLKSKIPEMIKDKEANVYILVSHGTIIDEINKILGFTGEIGSDFILYCYSYIYEIDKSDNKTKFISQICPPQ